MNKLGINSLKMIAIFFVIAIHVILDVPGLKDNELVHVVNTSIVFIAVPAFVIIEGYDTMSLYGKRKNLQIGIKIAFLAAISTIVFAIVKHTHISNFTWGVSAIWFLWMFVFNVGVIALLEALKVDRQKLNKAGIALLPFTLLVGLMVSDADAKSWMAVPLYLPLFILAKPIFDKFKSFKTSNLSLGFLITLGIMIALSFGSFRLVPENGDLVAASIFTNVFQWMSNSFLSPILLMHTLLFMVLFQKLIDLRKNKREVKLINFLGKLPFTIYIVHFFVNQLIVRDLIVADNEYYALLEPIGLYFLGTTISFLITTAIAIPVVIVYERFFQSAWQLFGRKLNYYFYR